jgi:putative aldouronate transport system substrate-binding protein
MKNTATKLMSLLVCLLMVVGMAACSSTASPTAAPTSAAAATDSPAATVAATEAATDTVAPTATPAPAALLDASVAPPQDPLGKFDPPITVTTILTANDGPFWFPKGDDVNNNIYTRTWLEKLGIQYKFLWTSPGAQAEEKINVMLASGDLPDMLNVSQTNFEKLYAAGKLADITSAMQNYASQYTKKYLTGEYAPLLDAATKNGKIYGETCGTSYTDSAQMIWIRSDWLKTLNMSVPKTLADLTAVMDAFVNKDPDGNGKADTYAIGTAGANMGGNSQNFGMGSAYFNMFHVYPAEWVKNASGDLEDGMFGSDYRNSTKTALTTLKDWYSKGYLNQDFATYDDSKYQEDMTSDKFGIVFGDLWGAYWPLLLCLDKNPKADWVPVAVPSFDDQKALTNNTVAGVNWINVCNVNYAHPEALVKMTNLYHDLNNNPDTATDFDKYNTDPKDNNQIFLAYPLPIYNPSFNYEGYLAINSALTSNDTSKLPAPYKVFYNQIVSYNKTADKGGWPPYRSYTDNGCYGVIKQYMDGKQFMFNEYTAQPTQSMIDNWPSVKKIYDQMFLSVVMGGDDSGYDSYISQYDSLYGTQAAKEVNDWFAAKGKQSVQDWYNNLK